ncbi:bifunctional 4-hydroxy-2-oxoglutarate aldolase/2-dehydro-3-deoxy-phosphogluconate aldolase [Aurantimonas sp. Leaf443]|uniref:bifunctional 4-hydroxy-2-oxoglutarate aldolase/2-dehydro-3-deoxy-phosphogluconate aldolase n=1 Tax=Aurantimonas sp. Leaf443 TaxID=1736378 RepID=UPI0007022C7D|nr:bifunctional 4-hydroxy-2-oxoglutarate aldolase/2-dehydro-3-deoxy-phosphogluconate aldolase [Aurantimonas sp. Leaf443]KQT82154.1 keto-deoxy-phosphogluconate aldolase [Aurantimonas sp. Leaf443]
MTQKTQALHAILTAQPVMPVVAVADVAGAVKLARALAKGGLVSIEITLRTPAALEAIRAVADEVPETTCGAGTVLSPRQFDQAVEAGARFVVSPGATHALVRHVEDSEVPLLPGAASPSELMGMMEAGYELLKFFPAEQLGGVPFLKALAPVFQSIRFCPTGGISMTNVGDYLALPNVLCVGGSWVAPKEAVEAGDFDTITRLAAEAAALKA